MTQRLKFQHKGKYYNKTVKLMLPKNVTKSECPLGPSTPRGTSLDQRVAVKISEMLKEEYEGKDTEFSLMSKNTLKMLKQKPLYVLQQNLA